VSEADVEHWNVQIVGPAGSPYANGIFKLNVTFPPEFLRKSPSVVFVTKIWHPLVNTDGQFCLPILSDWVVSQKTVNVFKALAEALANPSSDHAANAAVAEEIRSMATPMYNAIVGQGANVRTRNRGVVFRAEQDARTSNRGVVFRAEQGQGANAQPNRLLNRMDKSSPKVGK
jgi:ubiquitin-protein ligase